MNWYPQLLEMDAKNSNLVGTQRFSQWKNRKPKIPPRIPNKSGCNVRKNGTPRGWADKTTWLAMIRWSDLPNPEESLVERHVSNTPYDVKQMSLSEKSSVTVEKTLPHLTSSSAGPFLEPSISLPSLELTHQQKPVDEWHCFSLNVPSSLQAGTWTPIRFDFPASCTATWQAVGSEGKPQSSHHDFRHFSALFAEISTFPDHPD